MRGLMQAEDSTFRLARDLVSCNSRLRSQRTLLTFIGHTSNMSADWAFFTKTLFQKINCSYPHDSLQGIYI